MPAVHTVYTITLVRLSVHSVHECATPSLLMSISVTVQRSLHPQLVQ